MDAGYSHYRQEKEDFVSNLEGSTAEDVISAIAPNACSVLLALTTLTLLGPRLDPQSRTVIEFAVTVGPCILCCTFLSNRTAHVAQGMLILSAANLLSILSSRRDNSNPPTNNVITNSKRIPFLTNFRAVTNIITVVCILAVDFKCFPRHFAKTETYGFSLMDTGVGLFMIANALVAPEARDQRYDANVRFIDYFKKNAFDCLPLLALGAGRYVAVELLGYQRHVSEYGVHWNFFLTLACVKLFVTVLPRKITTKFPLLAGVWILAMHEYTLTTIGLKEWALSDGSRDDFMSANREGWISIPGYAGLYLVSVAIGQVIHSTYKSNISNGSIFVFFKLCLIIAILCPITFYCHKYFNVSRRLTNSGYCTWILFIGLLSITFLLFVDIVMESISTCVKQKSKNQGSNEIYIVKTLEIFEAINHNGLLFFVFANLLTGLINMSINTLRADINAAVTIIVTYMLVNVVFVLIKYRLSLSAQKDKKLSLGK